MAVADHSSRAKSDGHLPAATRTKSTWQHLAAQLTAAARGADPGHVSVALQIVFMLEGVECRPK
jgi:hypothetical protein